MKGMRWVFYALELCWEFKKRYLGHFQVGGYPYRSLTEGLYTL